MSRFPDSYMSRVLFATPAPSRSLDVTARRWRRLRTSLFDSYRPRAALHARPWPEMAREAWAQCQVLKAANAPHPGRF
jgi:hypothetical protein